MTLLECVVALAIFVGAGLAVLVMVERAVAGATLARDRERAADLARSAMAKLEAGLESPETLAGPVPAWQDDEAAVSGSSGAPTLWTLEVRTQPSAFQGLTLVTVKAARLASAESSTETASFTLTQLVRLGRAAEGAP
jgi:type II secretory pathway pseudopilin PulG